MSDLEDLIDRLSRSLDPVDRERFRQAAEAALADLPPAMVGPGTVYRAIELAWRAFFRPVGPQKASWSSAANRGPSRLVRDGPTRDRKARPEDESEGGGTGLTAARSGD